MSAVLAKGGMIPKTIAPFEEAPAYPKQEVRNPTTSPIQIADKTPLPPQITSNFTLNKSSSAKYNKTALSSTSAFFS